MTASFNREIEDRFIRYCRIDTQADEQSPGTPSTEKQYDLLNLLVEELRALGLQDVALTGYGAVLATIPATPGHESAPTVAFLAHVDTSPAYKASDVEPLVHRAYDGRDLVLPKGQEAVLSPLQFPYLATKVGEDIITSSGDTLLGADDKAGIAIIMAMAEHFLAHPELAHGPLRLCFTPDEEIGRGVHASLPGDLAADVAYTLDGAVLGEVVYETFSADKGTVVIEGVSTHPGQAKDTMVNALHLAARIIMTLPHVTLTPETTSGREGFIHIYNMSGGAAQATLEFILRDFEMDALEAQGALLQQVCATVQATEPRSRITCEIVAQYRNMRYWLENDMRPVDLAREACRALGIEPVSPPTRGGTDGSRLTELGVPTPNLFTGMQNFHGPLEWVSLQDMSRATAVCIELAQLWGKEGETRSRAQGSRPAGRTL
ncbi:MAG: peptidase T [Thermomicrobiales bacterium]|nr:peptidase T [Thermomicrobiales bacterium]